MQGEIEIVLVDDSDDDAELAVRALRKSGLTNPIVRLEDGEEALNYFFCRGTYANRDFGKTPKMVLLDLKLPKVNGLEVLEELKRDDRTRSIPVVMMTSSREDSDIARSYDLGVNSYVVKPVDFDQFVQVVQDLGLYWTVLNETKG